MHERHERTVLHIYIQCTVHTNWHEGLCMNLKADLHVTDTRFFFARSGKNRMVYQKVSFVQI